MIFKLSLLALSVIPTYSQPVNIFDIERGTDDDWEDPNCKNMKEMDSWDYELAYYYYNVPTDGTCVTAFTSLWGDWSFSLHRYPDGHIGSIQYNTTDCSGESWSSDFAAVGDCYNGGLGETWIGYIMECGETPPCDIEGCFPFLGSGQVPQYAVDCGTITDGECLSVGTDAEGDGSGSVQSFLNCNGRSSDEPYDYSVVVNSSPVTLFDISRSDCTGGVWECFDDDEDFKVLGCSEVKTQSYESQETYYTYNVPTDGSCFAAPAYPEYPLSQRVFRYEDGNVGIKSYDNLDCSSDPVADDYVPIGGCYSGNYAEWIGYVMECHEMPPCELYDGCFPHLEAGAPNFAADCGAMVAGKCFDGLGTDSGGSGVGTVADFMCSPPSPSPTPTPTPEPEGENEDDEGEDLDSLEVPSSAVSKSPTIMSTVFVLAAFFFHSM